MVDTGLYISSRPLRLLNNGKPGDEGRFKRPNWKYKGVEMIKTNSRHYWKHLPNYLDGDEQVLERRGPLRRRRRQPGGQGATPAEVGDEHALPEGEGL